MAEMAGELAVANETQRLNKNIAESQGEDSKYIVEKGTPESRFNMSRSEPQFLNERIQTFYNL